METEAKQFIGDMTNDQLNDMVCKLRNEPTLDYCGNIQWAIDLLKFVPEAVIMPDGDDYPCPYWRVITGSIYRGENLARLCVLAYLERNTL